MRSDATSSEKTPESPLRAGRRRIAVVYIETILGQKSATCVVWWVASKRAGQNGFSGNLGGRRDRWGRVERLQGITVPEDGVLRQLALRVLAHHAGPAASAEVFAGAAHRAYDDLARVSAQLIGQAGVDALTSRAVHLAQQEYPWLVHRREAEQPEGPFAQVVVCLKRQDPVVASEAAGSVLATLALLLVTFIGESLTMQLLRKAWPDAFGDGAGAGAEAT